MGKNMKVGEDRSKTATETARTSACINEDRVLNTLTSPLRKVLTGLSIGQVLMVVVTAATLGAFVNSNMNEIDMLKQTTENMQEKINLLSVKVSVNQWSENQTKLNEMEKEITDVKTSYETKILELSNNITEIKAEQFSLKSTVIFHDTRLKQLQLVIDKCICNATNDTMLQDLGERIMKLEADNVGTDDTINASKNITEMRYQISIHDERITLLEDNLSVSNGIQNLVDRITQIELCRTKDQEDMNSMNKSVRSYIETLNLSVASIERNITLYNNDIQGLYTSISDIESEEAMTRELTNTLNDSLTNLQADLSDQMQEVNEWNRSILQMKETVAINSHSIQNISERILVSDIERQTDIAAIEANNELLSQLGLDVNATVTLLNNLESHVAYIEGIKSAFTVTDPVEGSETDSARFTSAVTNIGGHYSISNGTFTCEYPGIYIFTLHILQLNTVKYAACLIRKNSKPESFEAHSNTLSSGSGLYSSSTSVILQLVRGDIIDVYCRSGLASIDSTYSSFSGFLNKAN